MELLGLNADGDEKILSWRGANGQGQDNHEEHCTYLQSTGHQEALCDEFESQSRGKGISVKNSIFPKRSWSLPEIHPCCSPHEFGGVCSASEPSHLNAVADLLPSSPPLAVTRLCWDGASTWLWCRCASSRANTQGRSTLLPRRGCRHLTQCHTGCWTSDWKRNF